jgi:flavin-dependent dehydrogenase
VVATGVPPVETYSFDFGPVTVAGRPQGSGGTGPVVAYAPRRTVLDKILVDAADRAGAEIREGFTVDRLLFDDDGTVIGIRGRDAGGHSVAEHARVVVGADGWSSKVARAVDAPVYNRKPPLQTSYFTYWSGLPMDGMNSVIRPDRGWGAFPTNDGLTLLVIGWPQAEAAAYKADVEGNYLSTLDLVPELAERVRGATREERFAGGSLPNFFRKPYGAGWALVGDAGFTKDSITAQGITDAFLDSEHLAAALHEVLTGALGFDDAMARHQRQRDAKLLPLYDFTTQLATLEPPPAEVQQLLGAIDGNQAAMDAFVSVIAGTLSPVEFFDPAHLQTLLTPPTPALTPS